MRLAALLFLLNAVGGATTLIPMSVEELTQAASEIAQVRVLDSWSAWNPQHTLIYTYSRVQVSRRLKGTTAGTLVVKQLGGSAGGYTQKVAGIRQFQPGEDALLFLRPSLAADHTMVIVGLMQGNFRVKQTATGQVLVSNGMPSLRSDANGRLAPAGGVMTMDQITARIQRARQ
jgi:hypothetical protein